MEYAIRLYIMVACDVVKRSFPWALLVGFIFGAGWLCGSM